MPEDLEVLDFSSGASGAEEFKKRQDEARALARGKHNFLSMKKDKDTVILRFLFEANMLGLDRSQPISATNPHDPATGWITVLDHIAVKTKAAPRDKPSDKDWSDKMSAVCRRTPIGMEQRPAYESCFICTNVVDEKGKSEKPSTNMYATAVLREEVLGSQELVDAGRIDPSQIGQKLILDQGDWIDEVDNSGVVTGKKVWRRRYVIVNMGVANFFSPLTTFADMNETILDRDYKIVRKGEPNARRVEYVAAPLNPYQVTVMRDGQPTVIFYDLREPEIAALYADSGLSRADIVKMISRKVSKAWYDRFFDISVEVPWKQEGFSFDDDEGAKPPSQQAGPDAPPPPPTPQQQAGQTLTAEPTTGPTKEQLDSMRDRVMNTVGGGAQAQEQQAAAPPPAPVAQPAAPAPAAQPAPAPVAQPAAAPAAAPAAPPMVGTPAAR